MKILITGASGFIGSNLLMHCVERNDEVTGIDLFEHEKFAEMKGKYKFLEENLNEKNFFPFLENDYDAIFHLAAINGTSNFYDRAYEVLSSGIRPTLNILDWMNSVECKSVLFLAGSSESYASIFEFHDYAIPTDEKVPLVVSDVFNARWSYAASKIASELAVINFCRPRNIPWIIGRFHNIYGPGMSDKHFILEFAKRAISEQVNLIGWQNTRSFMFINDALKVLTELVTNTSAFGQVINIGSSKEKRILDVAKIILQILNINSHIELLDAPAGSVWRRCPDIGKLQALLGNLSETDLVEGISLTLREMR